MTPDLEEQDAERATSVLGLDLVLVPQHLDRNSGGRKREPRTHHDGGGDVHPKQVVGDAACEG